MVREKKKRIIDIEKLHELIDSASLPKGKTLTPYEERKLQSLRQRLSDDQSIAPQTPSPPERPQSKPDNLQPQVIIHKPGETQKKEERVIQIALTPRDEKKQQQTAVVDFMVAPVDQFEGEPLYEVEKVDLREFNASAMTSGQNSTPSEVREEFIPVSASGRKPDEHLPEWVPVNPTPRDAPVKHNEHKQTQDETLPEFDHVDEPSVATVRPSYEFERKIPTEKPVFFEAIGTSPPHQTKTELRKREKEGRKQKKLEQKQANHEAKIKKQEEKRLAKEQKKNEKRESREVHEQQQEEHKHQELEAKKVSVKDEEIRHEERHLLKEREEKVRVEHLGLQRKEKEELRRRQEEEKQARQEAQAKEQEAKRLARDHDKKRQLEQRELQKKLQEAQKKKDLERRKTALEAKEKEREELTRIKEREEKLRLQRIEMEKKQKEEEIKRKTLAKKKAVHFVSKTTDIPPVTYDTFETTPIDDQPDDHMTISPWESLSEEIHNEGNVDVPLVDEEALRPTADKAKIKEQKLQQKRLANEQKIKERLERKELKQKEKERRKQEQREEKQPANLFKLTKENKQMIKLKEIEDKQAQKEQREQEAEAKKQQQEEQRRKEQMLEAKEIEQKIKEKEDQRQRHIQNKKERKRLSQLGVGTADDTGVVQDRKLAEQQQYTRDLVRIAADEKERRKNKVFERTLKKEQKKKEKEERKKKITEEMKAKKNMELHLEEERLKEKLSGRTEERTDPFVAFDSIDQETAVLLSKNGYTSVEKLREATVKNLVKIGVKKKNAQLILAESEEFIEWQVLDADDLSMKD
jgi:hypothetical protein